MAAIIIPDMTMRSDDIKFSQMICWFMCLTFFMELLLMCIINNSICKLFLFVKNVDAGAAKELMAHLVNLQSSLADVNKYVVFSLSML